MPVKIYKPKPCDANTFRHRYYITTNGHRHSGIPMSVFKLPHVARPLGLGKNNGTTCRDLEEELARGDHHYHAFHQVRKENGRSSPRNFPNTFLMTGTYHIDSDLKISKNFLVPRSFYSLCTIGVEYQLAVIDGSEFGRDLPYPKCFVIAGCDVDLDDVIKFLASMKSTSRFSFNENLFGANNTKIDNRGLNLGDSSFINLYRQSMLAKANRENNNITINNLNQIIGQPENIESSSSSTNCNSNINSNCIAICSKNSNITTDQNLSSSSSSSSSASSSSSSNNNVMKRPLSEYGDEEILAEIKRRFVEKK